MEGGKTMSFIHVSVKDGNIESLSVQHVGQSPCLMLGFQYVYHTPKDVAFYAFENREKCSLAGEKLVINGLEFTPVAYNNLKWKYEYIVDSFGYITAVERVLESDEGGIYIEPTPGENERPRWNFDEKKWEYERVE